MNNRRMFVRALFTFSLVLACVVAGHTLSPGQEQADEEKVTRKIIVTRDLAIVDGDTIDLNELAGSLHRMGEIDLTIVGNLDDLEGVGISKKRNEVVRFGGDVRVEEDETIAGAVVVFGGSATIAGVVHDDVVVLGGDLVLEETANIKGSVVCMGGEIIRMPGSRVGDQEISLGSLPFGLAIGPFISHDYRVGHFMANGIGFFASLVFVGLVLVFGAGAIFFFPRPIDRITATIEKFPFKSGIVGLLGEILLLPLFVVVSVILFISIIGIPLLFLAIPLAILGVITAFFFGYVGAGLFAGRKIGGRTRMSLVSPYRTMLVGILALLAFHILSDIVGLTGHVLWPVQAFLTFVGGVVCFLATTVGFGAVIMSKFGTRSFSAAREVKAEKTPAAS